MHLHVRRVIRPESRIIIISIGASTSFPNPANRKPSPNRYRFPLSKIISPIYMAIVTIAAIAVGSVSESSFLFPKVNDPVYTPIVIPNRAKNTAISTAESGETVISPVR